MKKSIRQISAFLALLMFFLVIPVSSVTATSDTIKILVQPTLAYDYIYTPTTNESFYGLIKVAKFVDRQDDYDEGVRWGFIDKTGKEVIKPIYNTIKNDFESDLLCVEQNRKWGFIDKKGTVKVPLIYDEIYNAYNGGRNNIFVFNGNTIASKDEKYGLINQEGKELTSFQYERAEVFYTDEVNQYPVKYIKVLKDGKYGIIDGNGKSILPIEYEIIVSKESFGMESLGYNTHIPVKKGDNWYLFDKDFKDFIALKEKYDDIKYVGQNVYQVILNGKWGLINETESTIYPINNDYDDNTSITISEFNKESFVIKKDNDVSIISYTGETIVPFGTYGYIFPLDINGLAYVSKDNKYGYINQSGNVVIPVTNDFDDSKMSMVHYGNSASYRKNNLYILKKQDNNGIWKYGLADDTGKEILPIIYNDINDIDYEKNYRGTYSGGFPLIVTDEEYNMGLIDNKGNFIINPIYKSVTFMEGFFIASKNNTANEKVYDLIDSTGNIILENAKEYKYKNDSNKSAVFIVNENNKYGAVDEKNNIIVPFIYDEINFDVKFLQCTLNNKVGIINFQGETVISVNYDNIEHNYEEINGKSEWIFKANIGNETKYFKENGNIITIGNTENDYDILFEFDRGYYLIEKDNKYGIIEDLKITSPAISKTKSKVIVNGVTKEFEAYNINGNNYFKLRDLAYVLNGTAQQFAVDWDNTKNAINLISGQAYTPVGGEMELDNNNSNKTASITKAKIYLDGKQIDLTAYNIGGNNYFKLRDIAEKINFNVEWDSKNNSVIINSK